MAPKARFTDGEKVLCFHGPLLYEAKCLSSQVKDKHMKYFIHYSGWNKNWDEWVPECRVLKYNDVNLQKQKELQKTHMKAKKTKNTKAAAKKEAEKEKEPTPPQQAAPEKPKAQKAEKRGIASPSAEPSKPVETKRTIKAESSEPRKMARIEQVPFEPRRVIKTEYPSDDEMEVKLCIPQPLQDWLIDDFDLINHQKKILHLPARITVDHIIANYVKEKVAGKGLSTGRESTIVHIANRIRDCFNVLLGKRLLYKFERPQYGEMLFEHTSLQMCEIYGGIHLLRMFTILGEMLSSIVESGVSVSGLVIHIEDFIEYLAKNPSIFSLDDYVVASPEYHRRALT